MLGGININWSLLTFFLLFSLLIFLFFCHVNLVIIYENGFKIFYKILFIKIRVFPFKEDKKQDKLSGVKDAKNAFDKLRRYRELSRSIFGFYYRALRLKIINLDIIVASKKPATTALYYSLVAQGVAYLFRSAEQNVILQFPKNSNINIQADFLGKKSHFKAHFVIYTYLGPLVAVSVFSFFKMIISFFRRLLNGSIKAKRAN